MSFSPAAVANLPTMVGHCYRVSGVAKRRGGGQYLSSETRNPASLELATRPRGFESFFVLNSTEHEIYHAHKINVNMLTVEL